MRAAGGVDRGLVAGFQRCDIIQMFVDGALVALAGGGLVPLVVIVEDDGDRIVEIGDEAVFRGAVDQQVEALVEDGEILEALVDVSQHGVMFVADGGKIGPALIIP